MLKKTALYEKHVASGGKMTPFAGYDMPLQFTAGIIKEHECVRNQAGLFDVSHMGEVTLSGKDALLNLNRLFTNDFSSLKPGQVRYSPMCNEEGGTLDDILVYKIDEEKYLLVVNASNRQKDFEWIKSKVTGDTLVEDCSDQVSQVALQGPLAHKILSKLTADESLPQKYYTFIENCSVKGVPCLVSKTGYTGEDGYELYTRNENAEKIWDILLDAGKDEGILPCGLGARDTLRLEAGMPLYGHELSEEITPKECGLSNFVKMEKDDFIGKEALFAPPLRKRIGLIITDKRIAREGAQVFADGEEVGVVTSGSMSPCLKRPIAMALIKAEAGEGSRQVDVRGNRVQAEAVQLPFYKRNSK